MDLIPKHSTRLVNRTMTKDFTVKQYNEIKSFCRRMKRFKDEGGYSKQFHLDQALNLGLMSYQSFHNEDYLEYYR